MPLEETVRFMFDKADRNDGGCWISYMTIMSASTCPGPTEGSWSTSSTINSAASSGTSSSPRCFPPRSRTGGGVQALLLQGLVAQRRWQGTSVKGAVVGGQPRRWEEAQGTRAGGRH